MSIFDSNNWEKKFEKILDLKMNQTPLPIPDCGTWPYNSNHNATNCTPMDLKLWWNISEETTSEETSPANTFFTFFTPILFTVGIVGNTLSLVVFMSKNMRKMSASVYLAALSISDLMALIFYVLPEWLKHGLATSSGQNTVEFLQYNGICQLLLYLQYIARFLSSWIVVLFTIERFTGVCFPLKRRKDICDSKSTVKVILGTAFVAALGCLFKPILSGSYTGPTGGPICSSNKDHEHLSFILDSIFGVTITLIPFLIITGLNLLIIRKLIQRNRLQRKIRLITEESTIRLEFTFILLAISICFVSLNLPYFAVWCKRYWTIEKTTRLDEYSSQMDEQISNIDEILHVTRTIFYMNYCINFFLYSVTGAYFRKELKQLFLLRGRQHPGQTPRNQSSDQDPNCFTLISKSFKSTNIKNETLEIEVDDSWLREIMSE